jgi:2-polyprenyl-6-methoxyphenol hydroxylase-like FAD-dependent oxidoreductase
MEQLTRQDQQTSVLIAGGGITGLTAAHLLLKSKIPFILIERHPGTSIHPRARGFDTRSMEIYRQLGLAEPIREAGLALAPSWGIHTAASMQEAIGKTRPRKHNGVQFPSQLKGLESISAESPELGARCTQDLSEPVLLDRAVSRGADIRLSTELCWVEQDPDGVTAGIKDRSTGRETRIRAAYLIAADGARSMIREGLALPTLGKGALGNLLNIYFEAELGAFVRGREFSLIRIERPGVRGLLSSINNTDRWVFHLSYDPVKGERPEDYTHERLTQILEEVIGVEGTAIRVISVLPWQPTVKVVSAMQAGRIFLAGDAAHVMTPYGGKGANTGVQDVHNLIWKLAMVLQGQASRGLLQSYSDERQPVGLYYAEQSGARADERGLLKKPNFGLVFSFLSVMAVNFLRLQRLFPSLPLRKLGGLFGLPNYRYCSGAVVEENPGDNLARCNPMQVTKFSAEPGTRLPHLWVNAEGSEISTLDVVSEEFVLLTGEASGAWRQAAEMVSSQMALKVSVYSVGRKADLVYAGSDLDTRLGISSRGALLVRPDGFVAWRSRELPFDPAWALKSALERILAPVL